MRFCSVWKNPWKPLLLADRELLAEAMMNLLDNAVKFTPPRLRVVLQTNAQDRL